MPHMIRATSGFIFLSHRPCSPRPHSVVVMPVVAEVAALSSRVQQRPWTYFQHPLVRRLRSSGRFLISPLERGEEGHRDGDAVAELGDRAALAGELGVDLLHRLDPVVVAGVGGEHGRATRVTQA